MTMQRTRRLSRAQRHDSVVIIETLEPRALLSSVSTFLKFAGILEWGSGVFWLRTSCRSNNHHTLDCSC